ncbi:hypothetical protein [Nocardia aurea]|uniref:hypothetical protein n=1 Tax=Nocardia aurea TaxID=2144174 RepID=UPI0033ADFDCE
MLCDVSLVSLISEFEKLKKSRRLRVEADECLAAIGRFAVEAHMLVSELGPRTPVRWMGSGVKSYSVMGGNPRHSRAINDDLFIGDHQDFVRAWNRLEMQVNACRRNQRLDGIGADEVNQVIYSAVMAWAGAVDVFQPSNGLAGTFFEMVIGPTISLLSGRPATGAVDIEVGGGERPESVKVDITFHGEFHGQPHTLAVPTKISTRERVSQPYVHARILESAFPGEYTTILCIGNENNAIYPPGAKKVLENMGVKETLVPGTISLYEKYVAHLDGLYYLDPPIRYVANTPPGFPVVKTIGNLLAEDLPSLLQPPNSFI